MTSVERIWFGIKETCERTGLSERTIKQAIYDGRLQTSQTGPQGTHRIHLDWIDEYMRNRGKPRTRRAVS